MGFKLPDAARAKIAIMRERAKLNFGKKKSSGGRRRSSSSGGRGWFGGVNALGGSLFELGSVAILGGVTIGSLFRLPAWLSPIGFALWLYGMWRGNGTIKALGLMLIALGFVDALGLPRAIAEKVQEAKAKGIIPMIGAGVAGAAAGAGVGTGIQRSSGDGSNLDDLVDDAVAVAEGVGAVREALA